MTQRKNKMIGFRPSNKLRQIFSTKCEQMRKRDAYTTKGKVLIELINMWVTGQVKIPGE